MSKMMMRRSTPPKRLEHSYTASQPSPKAVDHLLQIAFIIENMKPIWRAYEDRIPDWMQEMIRQHNAFEKEMQKGVADG